MYPAAFYERTHCCFSLYSYLKVDGLAHGVHAFSQGEHRDHVGRRGVDDDVVVHRETAVLARNRQRRVRLLFWFVWLIFNKAGCRSVRDLVNSYCCWWWCS